MRTLSKAVTVIIEALIAALILLSPFAFGAVEEWAYTTIEIIAAVMTALWLVKVLLEKGERRIRVPWILVPVCIFIAYAAFQIVPLSKSHIKKLSPSLYRLYAVNVNGYDAAEFLKHMDEKDYRFAFLGNNPCRTFLGRPVDAGHRTLSVYQKSTAAYLLKMISCLLIFFVMVNTLTTKEQMRRIVIVVIASGFLLAFAGIIQKLTWNGKLLWFRVPRHGGDPFGPYVNKNHFANYVGMIIPVTIGYVFSRIVHEFRRVQGNTFGLRLKNLVVGDFVYKIIMQIFLVAVMITAVIMSHSLLGTLSVLYGVLFIAAYMLIKNKKALLGIIIVLIVFIPLLISSSGAEIYIQQMYEKYMTFTESERLRLDYLFDGIKMIRDYFWTGTGLGAFWVIFPKYQSTGIGYFVDYAHNDYLQLYIETGIVAASLLIGSFILYIVVNLVPLILAREKRSVYYLMFGVIVGMIVMMMHSIGEFNFHIPANAVLFVVLAALIWSMHRTHKHKSRR
jgi:O-antigen ligase